MQITRRNFLATGAGAITAAAAVPAFAAWEESTRYPDPRIQILDPSFARYRIAQSSVERRRAKKPDMGSVMRPENGRARMVAMLELSFRKAPHCCSVLPPCV